MSKIYVREVNNCRECPARRISTSAIGLRNIWECTLVIDNSFYREIMEPSKIPDWCPLEKARKD